MNIKEYIIVKLRGEPDIKKLKEMGLQIGKDFQYGRYCFFDPSHCFLISIGDDVTFSTRVHLLAHDASTKKILGYAKIGRVDIGNHVFIGANSTILPGVKIGNNSIIGAGSVVAKDVEDDSVYAGVPARRICSVEEYCNKFKSIDKSLYFDENWTVSRVYGYKFVDDYLLQCKLDKKEVEKVILENVNEQKIIDDSDKLEKSLQYRKLHSWWELEDEDIEKIISDILLELQGQKYNPRYFKEIIVTLMQMEYQGISCFDYRDFVESMEQKLKVYTEAFELRYLEVLSDNAEFVEKYNEIVKPLFEILENKEKGEKKGNNDFLCNHEAWDDTFGKRCEEHREEYISDNKFFYYIEPEKFITQLQNAKVINIYNFMDGVRKVYSFSNLNEFFKSDASNIKCILYNIDVEKMSQGKITRNMAFVKLKSKLQEYLELIEKPIYKI